MESKNCPICNNVKTQRARCKSCPEERPDRLPEPKAFADALTADHAIINEDDASMDGDKVACVVQDQYSHWIQAFASHSESAEETKKAIKRFLGPQTKAQYAYTDNSGELKKAFIHCIKTFLLGFTNNQSRAGGKGFFNDFPPW